MKSVYERGREEEREKERERRKRSMEWTYNEEKILEFAKFSFTLYLVSKLSFEKIHQNICYSQLSSWKVFEEKFSTNCLVLTQSAENYPEWRKQVKVDRPLCYSRWWAPALVWQSVGILEKGSDDLPWTLQCQQDGEYLWPASVTHTQKQGKKQELSSQREQWIRTYMLFVRIATWEPCI